MNNSLVNPRLAAAMGVSQRETKIKGAPTTKRVGRETYDALMSLLSEEREGPTTPLGVFVANSTKRNLKRQMESIILP